MTFCRRQTLWLMMFLSTSVGAACGEKPTIVGAHTSQRVADKPAASVTPVEPVVPSTDGPVLPPLQFPDWPKTQMQPEPSYPAIVDGTPSRDTEVGDDDVGPSLSRAGDDADLPTLARAGDDDDLPTIARAGNDDDLPIIPWAGDNDDRPTMPRASRDNALPRLPVVGKDGLPILPMPGPVLTEPAMPSVPDEDNLEAPLPIFRCYGEALQCDRVNVLMTWLNDCANQQGCTLDMGCLPKDTLDCATVAGEDACTERGCIWHVPAPVVTELADRGLWDRRRYVDRASGELVEPIMDKDFADTDPEHPDLYTETPQRSVLDWRRYFEILRPTDAQSSPQSESQASDNVYSNNARHEIAVSQSPQLETQAGYCVAPERPEATALCLEQSTADACGSRYGVCAWHPVACTGQQSTCDEISDEDVCAKQIGCVWGVE